MSSVFLPNVPCDVQYVECIQPLFQCQEMMFPSFLFEHSSCFIAQQCVGVLVCMCASFFVHVTSCMECIILLQATLHEKEMSRSDKTADLFLQPDSNGSCSDSYSLPDSIDGNNSDESSDPDVYCKECKVPL